MVSIVVVGDTAYRDLQERFGTYILTDKIKRADGKIDFTYGELVAFSGDFYPDPIAIYNETVHTSWLKPLSNNVAKAKTLFAGEEEDVKAQISQGRLDYRDYNMRYLAAFPMNYLEMAQNNIEHFGWHNLKTYVRYHTDAINLALTAHASSGDQKADLFNQAIITNAFADHFLTDAFAAGHLRIPRAESLKWGIKNAAIVKGMGAPR
ncbi:MAG: hypothetical protein H7249_09395 [Chitinophagaceae bacterium]|nr:hypothetical protein [Oligoflexus sp.]